MKNPSEKSIQDAIIDLYLNVKIRKQDDLDNFAHQSLEREKEKLFKTNPMLILDYIKSSIEILINMKVQEKLQSLGQSKSSEELTDDEINVYEKELRHLESEIRCHIKIEHQLKLHTENMQTRIDELDTYKDELKQKIKSLQEQLNKSKDYSDSEYIENLKNENLNLKQIIKSYEERNISITELERKIREKQAKHERELKELEAKYKEKIRHLHKKLKYEDSSKALLTKDNTRVTDVTVDNNQLTDRVLVRNTSIAGITDRKREDYNSHNVDRKKDSSGKRFSENMKNIIDDLKAKKDCSFLSKKKIEKEVNEDISMNVSSMNINKNKNPPNELPKKGHTRTDSQVKLNENSSNLNLSKITNNKHTRNCSFDKSKQLSHNGNTGNKNINAMKDLISTHNYKSNNTQKLIPSQTMTPSMIADKTNNVTPSYIPTGNVIVNQNAVPCFNNINIYTSNMNNFKTNEINLKQYIINKMNTKTKGKQHHSRTTSTTANH